MTFENTASSVALLKKPLSGVSEETSETYSQAKAVPQAKAESRSSLPSRAVPPDLRQPDLSASDPPVDRMAKLIY